jgi:hypothetical protein
MKLKYDRVFVGLVLIVALTFAFTGCGKDGKAYGSYDWYGGVLTSTVTTTGGFPSGATYDKYYSFSEGSYYIYYYIYYGGAYYPPESSTYYYVSYNVKFEKGGLFSDGDDKYFDIYLGLSGASVAGLNRIGVAPSASQLASGEYSQTYGNDSMVITLNAKKVDASEVPKDELKTFVK